MLEDDDTVAPLLEGGGTLQQAGRQTAAEGEVPRRVVAERLEQQRRFAELLGRIQRGRDVPCSCLLVLAGQMGDARQAHLGSRPNAEIVPGELERLAEHITSAIHVAGEELD